MSGCFIKCPRCKTGHMRKMNNMIIGKKRVGLQVNFMDLQTLQAIR